MKLIFFSVIAALLFGITHCHAGDVILAWDANPEEELAGYDVNYGTSTRNYSVNVNVGNVVTFRINNLAPGTYFFAVRAYNTENLFSQYSNEVSTKILGAPSAPGNLRIIKVNAVTMQTKARIEWDTNKPARGHVTYGKKEPLQKIDGDGLVTSSHAVVIKDLARKRSHLYRITAATKDEKIVSTTQSFSTK